MKITITGDPGSGKSTVSKMLSQELKLKYSSTGEMFRRIAHDMNLSFKELTQHAEKDARIDKRIDNYQKTLGKKEDNFILEGRLGFHFIPDSIKIKLTVKPEEAAKRIMQDKRRDESYLNLQEAIKAVNERKASEKKRYKESYNIDVEDSKNYDLIIDTTIIPAAEVVKKIIIFLSLS